MPWDIDTFMPCNRMLTGLERRAVLMPLDVEITRLTSEPVYIIHVSITINSCLSPLPFNSHPVTCHSRLPGPCMHLTMSTINSSAGVNSMLVQPLGFVSLEAPQSMSCTDSGSMQGTHARCHALQPEPAPPALPSLKPGPILYTWSTCSSQNVRSAVPVA
jgi:hypothetical protein